MDFIKLHAIILLALPLINSCAIKRMYWKVQYKSDLKKAKKAKFSMPQTCEQYNEYMYLLNRLDADIDEVVFGKDLLDYDSTMARINKPVRIELDSLRNAKVEYIIEKDPKCIDAYLHYGLPSVMNIIYKSDTLLKDAEHWILSALEHSPNDSLLNFLMAYAYDMADSINLSRPFYKKATKYKDEQKTEKNIIKVLNSDKYYQDLSTKSDSVFFTISRSPTYCRTCKKIYSPYFKLFGNGTLELYDFFGTSDEPYLFKRQLSDSITRTIFNEIKDLRIFSMYRPFKSRISMSDFDLLLQWHLPSYSVSIFTPKVEHSFSVYGLGTIYGKNIMRQTTSITHMPELNKFPKTPLGMRIMRLSKICNKLFDNKFIYSRISEKHQPYIKPLYGSSDFIFSLKDSTFQRINFPDLSIKWKTPLGNAKPSRFFIKDNNVLFRVNNEIYAINPKSGKIYYKKSWPKDKYNYVNADHSDIQLGFMEGEEVVVDFFDSRHGKFEHTVKLNKNGKLELIKGKKWYDFMEDRYYKEMKEIKKHLLESNIN